MIVFLAILAVAIFAGIVLVAVSKSSGRQFRIAALGALALMVIATVVSVVVVLGTGSSAEQVAVVGDGMPSSEAFRAAEAESNSYLFPFVVLIVVMGLLVLALFVRERRKTHVKDGEVP